MRSVHLNKGGGRPACGYHRWFSEVITSTKDAASVTCGRCLRTLVERARS